MKREIMRLEGIMVLIIWEFFLCCRCRAPEDAIKCSNNNSRISNSSENYRTNCNVTNYLGIFPDRSICTTSMVKFPTSEEDLISIVADAARTKTKVKAISRFSHSIPKLVCPGGEKGVMIGTKNLNKIVEVDMEARTMKVQSGVTVREIIREAAKKGLALPHTPYWWGVTIGGLLATGAHGSSLWGKGGAIHDHVLELRIVTPAPPDYHAYAMVRTLDESHEEFNAAKVSLGLLGVISQVTLKLEPMFKRSVRYITKNDSNLGDEVVRFGHENEFGDIIWYPSQGEAVYRVDGRISINASANGTFDFFPFRPKLPSQLIAFRHAEEELEATRYSYGKCIEAKAVIKTLKDNAYGLTNDGKTFTGYPVIGYNNNMQSSGTCLTTEEDSYDEDKDKDKICPWDSRFNARFYHQTAFSIPLSSARSFILDIQNLVLLEPHAFCGLDLYNGILIRYIRASPAYLGKADNSVEFDLTYYRGKDPFTPRLHQDIFEEIEQMGLFKYGGLPHWGKNRDIAFHGVMRKYYDNGRKFLKVKKDFDPNGLFSSEWSDQVLGIKEDVGVFRDGCALEGLCVCSQDSHCAPSKGYFCRAGRVFKEARVCAFEDHKIEQASN